VPPLRDGSSRLGRRSWIGCLETNRLLWPYNLISAAIEFSYVLGRSESYARHLPFSPNASCRSSFLATPSSIEHLPSAWHLLCLSYSQISNTCDQSLYFRPLGTPWFLETHDTDTHTSPLRMLRLFALRQNKAAGSTTCSNFNHLHAWPQGCQDYTYPRFARV